MCECAGCVLRDDPDLVSHALADGTDIHFTHDGGELPFELVSYDAGTLVAWVSVDLDGPTIVELAYGGETVIARPTLAWTGGSLLAGWHLDRPGDLVELDSTFTVGAEEPVTE
jgi:hypothetical protein